MKQRWSWLSDAKQYLIAAGYVCAIAAAGLAIAWLMPKPAWMDLH